MRKPEKPKLCRPCLTHEHAGCDGPLACECPTCAQLREISDLAAEEAALLWPLDELKAD